MPPIVHGEYLIAHLYEMGLVLPLGMGIAPLTFGEIESWQRATGKQLQPWETSLLRKLSAAYVTEAHAAEKIETPPPYGAQAQSFDRDKVAKKVKNMMQSFTRN